MTSCRVICVHVLLGVVSCGGTATHSNDDPPTSTLDSDAPEGEEEHAHLSPSPDAESPQLGPGGTGGLLQGDDSVDIPELPDDCPSWNEISFGNLCHTCGDEPVQIMHRFPQELDPALSSRDYLGTCPPSEFIDFEQFGYAAPAIHREAHSISWPAEDDGPAAVECCYFVRYDGSRRHCD